MHLDYRQLATVLAALRIYQEEINNFGYNSLRDRPHFVDVEPMTLVEIDTLCERLNTSPSQPEPTTPESEARRVANVRLAAMAPRLLEALHYLLEQTVDQDLNHGIELTEGEEDARQQALAIFAELDTPTALDAEADLIGDEEEEDEDDSTISCTCHLKSKVTGPVPHCCPRHDGDYLSFLAAHNCD